MALVDRSCSRNCLVQNVSRHGVVSAGWRNTYVSQRVGLTNDSFRVRSRNSSGSSGTKVRLAANRSITFRFRLIQVCRGIVRHHRNRTRLFFVTLVVIDLNLVISIVRLLRYCWNRLWRFSDFGNDALKIQFTDNFNDLEVAHGTSVDHFVKSFSGIEQT